MAPARGVDGEREQRVLTDEMRAGGFDVRHWAAEDLREPVACCQLRVADHAARRRESAAPAGAVISLRVQGRVDEAPKCHDAASASPARPWLSTSPSPLSALRLLRLLLLLLLLLVLPRLLPPLLLLRGLRRRLWRDGVREGEFVLFGGRAGAHEELPARSA